jgi:hypothetical protein
VFYAVQRILMSVDQPSRRLGGKKMSSGWIIVGFFVFWLLLQLYILPKLGIST